MQGIRLIGAAISGSSTGFAISFAEELRRIVTGAGQAA
jgi:hypothetical protein